MEQRNTTVLQERSKPGSVKLPKRLGRMDVWTLSHNKSHGQNRVRARHESTEESQPPLMAGTIEMSDPGRTGLVIPPVYRTSSSPMKILTCSRIWPCSVVMRSRRPG